MVWTIRGSARFSHVTRHRNPAPKHAIFDRSPPSSRRDLPIGLAQFDMIFSGACSSSLLRWRQPKSGLKVVEFTGSRINGNHVSTVIMMYILSLHKASERV